MIRMKLKSMLLGLILLGLPSLLSAQLILFKGEVKDMGTGKAIPGVEVVNLTAQQQMRKGNFLLTFQAMWKL